MNKVLFIFGTRPEAIKMAPLIKEFNKHSEIETKVCVTGQHREMLYQALDFFDIKPDFDLNIMKQNQTLSMITSDILTRLDSVLNMLKPDHVFVHGDTTTTMAASLSAFYHNIKIWHIEAGLRTWNIKSPFPEEANRQITGKLAFFHAAPTTNAKNNLIKEQVNREKIFVTGNTIIDALLIGLEKVNRNELLYPEIKMLKKNINLKRKIILVTLHRRENQGELFIDICSNIRRLAMEFPETEIVFPVHMNPNIRSAVSKKLNDVSNVKLTESLSYPCFIWLMNKSYLILSDSGGIQEEAPSLHKPVVVARDTSERPEAIEAGTAILADPRIKNNIFDKCSLLLSDQEIYHKMVSAENPFGDGTACKKIFNVFKKNHCIR